MERPVHEPVSSNGSATVCVGSSSVVVSAKSCGHVNGMLAVAMVVNARGQFQRVLAVGKQGRAVLDQADVKRVESKGRRAGWKQNLAAVVSQRVWKR